MTVGEVLQSLENMLWDAYNDPSYPGNATQIRVLNNAVNLISVMKPRLLSSGQVRKYETDRFGCLWVEVHESNVVLPAVVREAADSCGRGLMECVDSHGMTYAMDSYGREWRCWTARPSVEQMESTVWSGCRPDREKVLRALDICLRQNSSGHCLDCTDCPYCPENADVCDGMLPILNDVRDLLLEDKNAEG